MYGPFLELPQICRDYAADVVVSVIIEALIGWMSWAPKHRAVQCFLCTFVLLSVFFFFTSRHSSKSVDACSRSRVGGSNIRCVLCNGRHPQVRNQDMSDTERVKSNNIRIYKHGRINFFLQRRVSPLLVRSVRQGSFFLLLVRVLFILVFVTTLRRYPPLPTAQDLAKRLFC
jgi:hypothetical protein